MADLQSPKLIYLKGFLFLLLGLFAAGLLLYHAPSWNVFALLLICIWGFCRFYYFAFYVIEHYVDDGFKYAGLFDFFSRTLSRKQQTSTEFNKESKSRTNTSTDSN